MAATCSSRPSRVTGPASTSISPNQIEAMARILIADDESLMRDMAGESLRRAGHDVVLARNVAEALEKFNEQIDLILSDYKMPGATGLDFLKKIRERGSDVPFVIMTAHGTISVAVDAMRHAAWDF